MRRDIARPIALPCLLDRLTDDNPSSQVEAEDSMPWLRASYYRSTVLRDLGWLLNTALRDDEANRPGLKYLSRSTFSYGVPAMAGRTLAQGDADAIRLMIHSAITRFEPRIDPGSIEVKITSDDSNLRGSTLVFQISGALWYKPAPISFVVRTLLDMDRGDFQMESHGSSAGHGK